MVLHFWTLDQTITAATAIYIEVIQDVRQQKFETLALYVTLPMDSPNCDGSRSYESIYSRSVQYPRDREVHHNAAYDSTLDCEELQSVGVESKDVP